MPKAGSDRLRLSGFYAAVFLVMGIQLPFWPAWLAGRGLDADAIGLVLAAAIWAKVIATPALGALADRLGRRRAVMAGLAAVSLLAYLALWPALGFWSLLLLNLVAGFGQSGLLPLGDSITLARVRERGLDYGRIRLWGSLSFILAALASGAILQSQGGERVLPLVIGASAILFLVVLALPGGSDRPEGGEVRRPGAIRAMLGRPRFWGFVMAASMLQASHQVYYGFGTLYWRSLGWSDGVIGWLWAEGVIAEIVLFWQGRALLERCGGLGLMALGGIAGILRWSLVGVVASLPATALLQLLHAFTFGASHLGAMQLLSRSVPPAAAASAQSIYAALSAGLGSGLVMLAAGALYRHYGGGAYLFMALLSAAGLLGTGLLRRARSPE